MMTQIMLARCAPPPLSPAQRRGLTMLRPTKGMGHPSLPPSLAMLRFGRASDGGSEGMAWPDPTIEFAELEAHNQGAI